MRAETLPVGPRGLTVPRRERKSYLESHMSRRKSAGIEERLARVVTGGAMLLLVGLVLAAGPAAVYASPGGDHGHPESSANAGAFLLLAVLGAGLAVFGARRTRATAIVTLALLVGIFGLESAVHSVHHASDPQSATSCPLFSASQHTQSGDVPTPATGIPTWTSEPSLAFDLRPLVLLAVASPHEGRAPPVLLSA